MGVAWATALGDAAWLGVALPASVMDGGALALGLAAEVHAASKIPVSINAVIERGGVDDLSVVDTRRSATSLGPQPEAHAITSVDAWITRAGAG